jgi:uncharacterized membrane protein (DUF4010 family)
MEQDIFVKLGIALGLGLLVGWQRERVESHMAGLRTFPLITMLGTMCGLLAERYGGWIVAAGLGGVAGLALMANLVRMRAAEPQDPGQTTEAAALLMFGVGAYLVFGSRAAAVAVAGAVAVLLYLKEPLRIILGRVSEDDFRAVMKFVVISLVILPVLPDETYGLYDVLNPREIWLMVCVIVGIGIVGYAAYKFFGQTAGTLLGGVLGGLISSTATTVSYSRRTKDSPDAAALAAVVIMIASTVAFARVLVEIALVASGSLSRMAPPLATMLGFMAVISGAAYFLGRADRDEMPQQENPAELKGALLFGALYALVLFGVAAAKDHFGSRGLYGAAVISGLTDMDAITLSTANLTAGGRLDPATGWRLIFVASLSNLIFKAGMVAALGHVRLLLRIAILYGIALAGGALLLWLWPDGMDG